MGKVALPLGITNAHVGMCNVQSFCGVISGENNASTAKFSREQMATGSMEN